MNADTAFGSLPTESPYRDIIKGLLNSDENVREQALYRLKKLDTVTDYQQAHATTWNHSEADALVLLNLAISLPFPPQRLEWNDTVHDLIFPLIRSPYPSLVMPVRKAYPQLSARAKCAALCILGATSSRIGAEAFIELVREHGWPSGAYSRVFTELHRLLNHSDILFPTLIQLAGEYIGGVTDLLVAGFNQGSINLAEGKVDLEPIVDIACGQLKELLKSATTLQQGHGLEWRFAEDYFSVRNQTGAWLDIAGYLKSSRLEPLLFQALSLSDPRLAAYAAVALLRHGVSVQKEICIGIAACHETRAMFFELLKQFGRLDYFPSEYCQWDAFAAADMVQWLSYPTELGREPDELQLMATFSNNVGLENQVLYVWRFRTADGPWYASTSGPYRQVGKPVPLHGNLTFSRFDDWDKHSAEQHAEASLETFAEWRKDEK